MIRHKIFFLIMTLIALGFALFLTVIKAPLLNYKKASQKLVDQQKMTNIISRKRTKIRHYASIIKCEAMPIYIASALKEQHIHLNRIKTTTTGVSLTAHGSYQEIKDFFKKLSEKPNPLAFQSIKFSSNLKDRNVTLSIEASKDV